MTIYSALLIAVACI